MKGVLLAVLGLFSLYSIQAQIPASVPEAPYLKNPTLPPFKLIEVDSVHFLTKDNIKKKPGRPDHVLQSGMRTL